MRQNPFLPLLILSTLTFMPGCSSGSGENSSSGIKLQPPDATEPNGSGPALPAAPPSINLPFNTNTHPSSSLKIARSTPDFAADGATRTLFTAGQVNFSWDGHIRFVPTGGGIRVTLADYDQLSEDASGRTVFSYRTGNPSYPDGVPFYRQLNLVLDGPCAGQKYYDIPQSTCGTPNNRVTLDEPAPPAVGTGLTYPWHFQILPDPDFELNPFPSDSAGNPASTVTRFKTYRVVYLGSVVLAPQSGDSDFLNTHPYFTNGADRNRLVTGLGKIVVETTRREGNHSIPTQIVSAGVIPETFSVVHIQGSTPSAPKVARGIEPTAPRYLDFLAYQSYLAPTSPQGNAGIGHVFTVRKLQGNYRNPRCTLPEPPGAPPCQELLFSNPQTIAALHTFRDQVIPGTSLTYGQRYILARYKLASPTLDKIYGASDYFGMAYPWISPEGDFLLGTSGFATGNYLDRNATSLAIQRNGGLEYCIFDGPSCEPHASQRNIRREAYLMFGGQLIASNGIEEVFQAQTLDNPLNEWPRTLARVTAWSPGIFDGLWGPAIQNPVARMRGFKKTPGTDILPLFVSLNNHPGTQGSVDKVETTALGQVDVGAQRRGYLFYTGFANVGDFVPTNGGLPYTGFRTNLSRTQDVSGNNLLVTLSPGVVYPFNDPDGNYSTPPLLDNARQLQIGRVGQGVYCSQSGLIGITEQAGRSRPQTLSSYSDKLSFQAWVKPRLSGTAYRLAETPAFTLSLTANLGLTSTVRGGNRAHSVTTSGTIPLNQWTHVIADYSIVRERSAIRTRIHINGKLALDLESASITGITQLTQSTTPSWSLCNGATGSDTSRVIVLDEVGIAARILDAREVRAAALIPDPQTQQSEQQLRSRLGPLAAFLDNLGIDIHEAHVPSTNPITLEKFALGQKIFFDPNLSANNSISCASCHAPVLGYGSPSPSGKGVGINGALSRRAPPRIVNLIFNSSESLYNWDESAPTLEDQLIGPFTSATEMGLTSMNAVVQRVRANTSYASLVANAFPGRSLSVVSELEIRQALATFVRMLVVGDAPYDRFRAGDASALNPSQRKGYGVFVNHCAGCHSGHGLSSGRAFNIGAYPLNHSDLGKAGVTGNPRDRFAFRTPGLRDLHLRRTEVGGPQRLGHDGQLNLQQLIANYMAGGTHPHPNKGPDIRSIQLSQEEISALQSFLNEALISNFNLVYTFIAP